MGLLTLGAGAMELCESFKFPHHSGFMPSSFEFPSDLHIHSSFEFHPKLRSVSTLPSALTDDSVTLSVGLLSGALLKSQACMKPLPELVRGTLDIATSPNQSPAQFLPKCNLFWERSTWLKEFGEVSNRE